MMPKLSCAFLLIRHKAKVLTLALKAPLDLSPGYFSGLTFKSFHLNAAIQPPLLSEHSKRVPSSGNHAGLESSSYIFIPRANTTIFCSNVTWSVRLLLSLIFSLVCMSHHSTHYALTVSLQPWNASSMRAGSLFMMFISVSPVPGTEPG